MRIVIADDEMLLREGLARLLADAGFDVVAKATDGPELLRAVRLTDPDVAIVDIKMPPTHTDEGLVAARRSARRILASACSSCRTTSSPPTRMRLLQDASRSGSATCSKNAFPTSPSSPTRCDASPTAKACSTRRSWRASSTGRASRTHLPGSPTREREVLELIARRTLQPAISDSLSAPRPSRPTSARSSRSSSSSRRPTRTGACSRCSPFCAPERPPTDTPDIRPDCGAIAKRRSLGTGAGPARRLATPAPGWSPSCRSFRTSGCREERRPGCRSHPSRPCRSVARSACCRWPSACPCLRSPARREARRCRRSG